MNKVASNKGDENKEAGENIHRLSYSSSQLLALCEYKYYAAKIAKFPVDEDSQAQDDHALRFGSALHYIMEMTLHDKNNYTKEYLKEALLQFKLTDYQDMMKLIASCLAYYKLSAGSELRIIHCELEIKTSEIVGYVDAIGVDSLGRWWIVDLKTTSWFKALLPIRLRRDPQLSIYAAHKEQIAEKLGLKVEDFGGVIYRVVSKSKHVVKPDETAGEFLKRAKILARAVMVPASELDENNVMSQHLRLYDRSVALLTVGTNIAPGEEPLRNYSRCLEWERPCEYWSRCYGKSFTECQEEAIVCDQDESIDVGSVGYKEDVDLDAIDLDDLDL